MGKLSKFLSYKGFCYFRPSQLEGVLPPRRPALFSASLSSEHAAIAQLAQRPSNNPPQKSMALLTLALPSPSSLRGGWAAMSAVCAARGWLDSAYATDTEWHYHDGGGNWACLRFVGDSRAVLLGNDHEYSDTYFREAATYFQEEETNLLAEAPAMVEPRLAAQSARRVVWLYLRLGRSSVAASEL